MLRRNVRLKIQVEYQRHADRWGLKPWGWTRGEVLRQTAGHEKEPPMVVIASAQEAGVGDLCRQRGRVAICRSINRVNTAQS